MAITLPQLDIVTKVVNAFAHDGAKAVDLTGPWGSGKSLVAAQAALALNCSLLVITQGRGEAERVHEDLGTLLGPERCALFPAWEVLPTETMAPSDDIVAERMNTLERLTSAFERGELMYVVVPVGSLLQYVADRNQLRERIITLGVGEEHDLDHVAHVRATGSYAGHIRDMHPFAAAMREAVWAYTAGASSRGIWHPNWHIGSWSHNGSRVRACWRL